MVEARILVNATVTAVGDEHFLYPCCMQCCSKMLMDMLNNRWRCLKCNISCSIGDLEWRYRIKMTVADLEQYRQISVFGRTLQPYFGTSANTFHRFVSHLHVTHPDVADGALKQAVEMTFVGNNYFFGFPSTNEHLDNISVSSLSMAVHRKGDNSDLIAMQMISPDDSHVTTVSECISYLLKKNPTNSIHQTFLQEKSLIDNSDFRERRASMKGYPGSILEISENNSEPVDGLISILFSCENSLSTSMSSTSRQANGSLSSADGTTGVAAGFLSEGEDISDINTLREAVPHTRYAAVQPQKSVIYDISAVYKLHEDDRASSSSTRELSKDGDVDADTLNESSLLLIEEASPCPRTAGLTPIPSPVELLRREAVTFDPNPGVLHGSLRVQPLDEDETSRSTWTPSDELQDPMSKQEFNVDLADGCDFEEMPYSEDLDEFLLKTTSVKAMKAISKWEKVLHEDEAESHPKKTSPNILVTHNNEQADVIPRHREDADSNCTGADASNSKIETKLPCKDFCPFDESLSCNWEEMPESEDLELFLQRAEEQIAQPHVNNQEFPSSTLSRNKSQPHVNNQEFPSSPDPALLNSIDCKNRMMPSMNSVKNYVIDDKTSNLQSLYEATAATAGQELANLSSHMKTDAAFDGSMELFDTSADLFDDVDDYQEASEHAGTSTCRVDTSSVGESVDESVHWALDQKTPTEDDGSSTFKKQVKFAKRLSHISSVQLIDIRMKLTFGVAPLSPSSPGRSCLRRSLFKLRKTSVSGEGLCWKERENIPVQKSRDDSHEKSISDTSLTLLSHRNAQTSYSGARTDSGICLQSQDLFLPSPDLYSPLSTSLTSPIRVVAISQKVRQNIVLTKSVCAQAQLRVPAQLHAPGLPNASMHDPSTCVLRADHYYHGSTVQQKPPHHKASLVFPADSRDSGVGGGGDCDSDNSPLLFSESDRTDCNCSTSSTPTGPYCQDMDSELTPDLFDSP